MDSKSIRVRIYAFLKQSSIHYNGNINITLAEMQTFVNNKNLKPHIN